MIINNIDEYLKNNKALVYFSLNKFCPENYRDEDMAQICFIAMYTAIEKYRENENASLHHYIIRCMRNAIYNELKRRNRYKNKFYYLEDLTNKNDNSFVDNVDWEKFIEDINVYKEDYDLNIDVENFIKNTKLSNNERAFYEYRKLGFLDIEIASKLGVSRQRINQIKNNFRKKWNNYFANYYTT